MRDLATVQFGLFWKFLQLSLVWSRGAGPFMPLNMTTPHMLYAVLGPYGWTVISSSSSQNSVVAKTIRKKSTSWSKSLEDKVPQTVTHNALDE